MSEILFLTQYGWNWRCFCQIKKNAKKTTIIIHLWKPRTRCLWFRAVLAGDEKQKKIKTSWDTKSLKNRKVDGHGQ